jgi:hypothetical protein
MHCGEFKIAPSISAPLLEELKDFQRKVSESGRTQYDARSGALDDLILSCAIGLWFAMSGDGEVTCEPIPWMEPDPAGWYRAQRQEPRGYRQ